MSSWHRKCYIGNATWWEDVVLATNQSARRIVDTQLYTRPTTYTNDIMGSFGSRSAATLPAAAARPFRLHPFLGEGRRDVWRHNLYVGSPAVDEGAAAGGDALGLSIGAIVAREDILKETRTPRSRSSMDPEKDTVLRLLQLRGYDDPLRLLACFKWSSES